MEKRKKMVSEIIIIITVCISIILSRLIFRNWDVVKSFIANLFT